MLAAASMLASAGATAQTTQRPILPPSPLGDAFRYRIATLGPAPNGDRPDRLAFALQRRTYRLGGAPLAAAALAADRGEAKSLSYDPRPRSRVTSIRMEDRFTIGAALEASVGWRGFKVSNRNANVMVGAGNNKLMAKDWFLPRATLRYRPAEGVTLEMGYRETMRAYEGAGSTGSLGLSRDDFAALRADLLPERSRQWRIDGRYQAGALQLSLGGFRVAARDMLGFADRSYVPGNLGSLTVSGVSATAEHRLTPALSWSTHYRRATGRTIEGQAIGETEMGFGGVVRSGVWQGTVGAARSAAVDRRMRVEAGIDYEATGIARRPLHLSAYLSDPSRLASVRLLEDSGALRASDRARSFLVAATMPW